MRLPNITREKKLWQRGFQVVAGTDEVGRGSFAGPIVAGCVVFSPNRVLKSKSKIDDSKKLTPRQREIAAAWIKKNSLGWGIGVGSVAEINRRGLGAAAKTAFRRAIYSLNRKLGKKIDYLLIDAFYIPYVVGVPALNKKSRQKGSATATKLRQWAIIQGDHRVLSIAAGSIIAKVYRDKLMRGLSRKQQYKKYAWEKNKGYGTRLHLQAIQKYGSTRLHRKKFIQTYLSRLNS